MGFEGSDLEAVRDFQELKKFICNFKLPIVDAMKLIDENTVGMLFVVDDAFMLAGSLTNGDIRRWIIKTGRVDGLVCDAMNKNPVYLSEREIGISIQVMKQKQIYSLAVVDDYKKIKQVLFQKAYLLSMGIKPGKKINGTSVIIMAGGKGTRLYPYTKILPKPLIPIGDVPIIERVLDKFHEYGVQDFYIVVNYKKEMLKSYFSEVNKNYNITFVNEKNPLGTAGGIKLIDTKFDRPVIITNCDILIESDYRRIVDFHKNSYNEMTIVSSLKNTVIPYGVIHSKEEGVIVSLEEKPHYSHFINTGMYVVNPKVIDLIPDNQMFHMTDLADVLIKKKKKVGMYPISENSFLDMGQFEEMKKMEEKINDRKQYWNNG